MHVGKGGISTPCGAGLIAMATFLYAWENVLIRHLSPYSPIQILFFKASLSAMAMGCFFHRHLRSSPLFSHPSTTLSDHALRALLGHGGLLCLFYAIAHGHLGDVIPTSFLSVLFVPLISGPFLAIWPRFMHIMMMVGGVAGVWMITGSVPLTMNLPIMCAILFGLGEAFAVLSIRYLHRRYTPIITMIMYPVLGSCMLGILLPFVWITPTWDDMFVFMGIGGVSLAGNALYTWAYTYGHPMVLTATSCLSIVWALIMGHTLYHEPITAHGLLGSFIIIMSIMGMMIADHRVSEKTRAIQ